MQYDVLNLLSNPQLTKNSTEQARAEQMPATASPFEPLSAEKTTNVEPIIVDSLAAEQSSSHRAEQTTNAEPPQPIEQTVAAQTTSSPVAQIVPPTAAQTTPPPPAKDEGYGHGVTIDSMIVAPCVPTLVEESTNVGTKDEGKTLEETTREFATTSSTLGKTSFMKQYAMTLIYIAEAFEKEAELQGKTKKLAEERLGKIHLLES